MWFGCSFEKRILHGSLLYLRDELSLCFEPNIDNGFSYMLGAAYASLDVVCDTGEVVQVSGCNPHRVWKRKNLTFPASNTGFLYIHAAEPFVSGTGVDSQQERVTHYDPKKSCICMGGTWACLKSSIHCLSASFSA